MSQTHTSAASPRQWCDAMQAKLMAALDAAWALAEASGDPAVIARAREKARLCGQMAATARKIAAMTPAEKAAKAAPEHPLDLVEDFVGRMDKATTSIAAANAPPSAPKPPAAQALAMQAALARMKKRP